MGRTWIGGSQFAAPLQKVVDCHIECVLLRSCPKAQRQPSSSVANAVMPHRGQAVIGSLAERSLPRGAMLSQHKAISQICITRYALLTALFNSRGNYSKLSLLFVRDSACVCVYLCGSLNVCLFACVYLHIMCFLCLCSSGLCLTFKILNKLQPQNNLDNWSHSLANIRMADIYIYNE